LGDVQSSLKTIKELKNTLPLNQIDNKLFVIEGSALISSGEYQSGKEIIIGLLNKIDNEDEKSRLKVELAYADFELKMYEEAREQCNILLDKKSLSPELMGRSYNLKGMIDIYLKNDLNSALENFQNAKSKFSEVGQPARVAGVDVNIGNIYSIQKDYEKAEMHWQSASEINKSIGNLEQEGLLLQNLGIFYFNRQRFDSAVQSYQKAIKIFSSIGNDLSRGLVLWDLGEIYIAYCEYENALNSLNEAQNIFEQLNNYAELLDVLFMKGKLFYKIGAFQNLEKILDNFQTVYSKHNQHSSHQVFQKLLVQLKSFHKEKIIALDELKLIQNEMNLRRDNHNLFEVVSLLIQYYIHEKWYPEAIKELFKPELIDLCSQNSILEAEREYFLGIISKNYESDKLLSPLVYFEKAYDLIKDESVTELTWKVTYEISQLYVERGNYTKAKRFVVYARELIYFIAEKLESPQLRAAYLKNSERFETLKKLESFYPG
ncbi:MAG TPA: tetratricopeptide repeat protein, partial [Ignavibacteriaceae bacterium]